MKASYIFMGLLFSFADSSVQSNTFPANGNVGIGILSPQDKLHVFGGAQKGEIRIGGSNGANNGRVFIQADFIRNNGYIDAYGDDFKIINIRVYDKRAQDFLELVVYVSSGTVSGYSLTGGGKHDVDLEKIEVSNFRKEYIENRDFNRISAFLDVEERQLISPSSVYSVFLEEKEYFRIKDLEDGDFIGIDLENNIHRITHDPFEITILPRNQLVSLIT